MPTARIYQPDKTAMQSGKSKDSWLLEFAPEAPYFVDNLMGWVGMSDMKQQLNLRFPSKEAAIAYAKKHKIEYEVIEPKKRTPVPKAYADNFKFSKIKG